MLKPNKIRQLLAVAIIVAGVFLVATIAVRVSRDKGTAPKKGGFPAADISLQKIRYTETKQGKKLWDLVADKADYDKERDTVRLNGVRLVIVGGAATGNVNLVAERAEYLVKPREVILTGMVKATSTTGMEFTTTALRYKAADALLTTPEKIHFSDGMLTVEGVGMDLDLERRVMKISRQVSTKIIPEQRIK